MFRDLQANRHKRLDSEIWNVKHSIKAVCNRNKAININKTMSTYESHIYSTAVKQQHEQSKTMCSKTNKQKMVLIAHVRTRSRKNVYASFIKFTFIYVGDSKCVTCVQLPKDQRSQCITKSWSDRELCTNQRGYREQNSGPREEHKVLLKIESSHQSRESFMQKTEAHIHSIEQKLHLGV